MLSTTEVAALPEGRTVKVAGLVVARQRPGTAKGVVFVLLEDEAGVINIVMPPPVYERYRVTVRSEPLLTMTGRVERKTGALNVVATAAEALAGPGDQAPVHQIRRPQTGEYDLRRVLGRRSRKGRGDAGRAGLRPRDGRRRRQRPSATRRTRRRGGPRGPGCKLPRTHRCPVNGKYRCKRTRLRPNLPI